MTNITLSICIPTYNRADFLDYLLDQAAKTWNFDFSYEIVISDNASTDRTADMVKAHIASGLPIRYFRQPLNKGSVANVLTGFHRARGEFVLYLADDDLLIPEGLAKSIAYLQANPKVRALYAPWELYDNIAKRASAVFYTTDRDMVFEPGQEGDLFAFLVKFHIFPEIVIYRAEAVRKIVSEHHFCFWAFSYLANVMAQGAVAFVRTPFYRSVTLTNVEPNRSQAGFEQAMTSWDSYRGGLEYLVYVILRRGNVVLDPAKKASIGNMIDSFIAARMKVALRLWLERRDFLRAYELLCRIHFLDPAGVAAFGDVPNLRLLAFGQTLAHFANSIAELSQVLIVGSGDVDSFRDLLREMGLADAIEVRAPADTADADALNSTLVVLANDTDRQVFLDRGYQQGLIISENDFMSGIHLLG